MTADNWAIYEAFIRLAAEKQWKPTRSGKKRLLFQSTLELEYRGQIVRRLVSLPITPKRPVPVNLSFMHAGKRWRQGIHVETDDMIEVLGARSPKIILWQDTAPETLTLTCSSKSGVLRVWNIWDTGNGSVESLFNCCGIVLKSLSPRKWELRCNDGYPDDDFADLIVQIEMPP